MILDVQWDERKVAVEVTDTAGGRVVKVDGRETACDCVRLANGQYSLILDGRVFDLSVEVSAGKCLLAGRGVSWALQVADARKLGLRHEAAEGQSGLQRIAAEMPGKVIRLLVAPGDTVAPDQGLLVLEAMKMQNEIRAPKAGTVREIGVSPGATVSTGAFLVSIES